MNRTSAIALFLLIFITNPTVLPAKEIKTLRLIFGQLFSIFVGNDVDTETLPNWMEFNGTNVYGIPQLDKVKQNNEYPSTKIHLGGDNWLNIEYSLLDPNPCEYEDTLFFEVYKDKAYNDYPIKNLSEIIQDFATIMDVKVPYFRVFQANYLKVWRRENNEVLNQLDDKPIRDDQLVIVWKLGCGSFDDDEDNYNIVTVVSDNQFNFRVIQGIVNENGLHPDVKPVTPPSTFTELERTTRQVDSPPIRILPLGEYRCVKGKICSLPIPNGIFIDDLDSKLKYSVHPINHDERFLEAEELGEKIKGIALKTGQFDFRMDARDRSNQVASVPFIVEISDEKDADYRYKFILDHEYSKFNAINRFNFLKKLAEVLSLDAEKMRLDSFSKGMHRQTEVELHIFQEHDVCNVKELKKILQNMANKNGDAKMLFVKKMGETFHVRKIKLEMNDRCSNGSQETEKVKDKKPETTHIPMVEASDENVYFQSILIPFIFIIIILILVIVVIVYCCMFKKPRTKKQNKPLEYVTKGQPVVFPNELGHDEDIVSVSVPMLVKDERPPLQPHLDGTTIHENPLYKAPSAGRTSFSTDNSNFNTAGTPRAMGTPNQRLPPPYVEP